MSPRIFRFVVPVLLAILGSVSSVFSQAPPDQIKFIPYEGNPVLEEGTRDEWDGYSVTNPEVVFHDGLFHMFCWGIAPSRDRGVIGHATSTDGLVWQKDLANPILTDGDEGVFDDATVSWPVVLVDGDTWLLYYAGQDKIGGTIQVGRASASGPSGPWTKDAAPVLAVGGKDAWDHIGVYPVSAHKTDEGYMMFYAGGPIWTEMNTMIGLATSPDGVSWTKYDDPSTADPPYAESDPVLQVGFEGWLMRSIWGGDVLKTENGWEMFYSEKGHPGDEPGLNYYVGCATSDDAIHWIKCPGNPILSPEDDAERSVYGLFVDSVVVTESTYMLYYDYEWKRGTRGGISVAIGRIEGD